MKKLAFVADSLFSATSLYRGAGPLSRLMLSDRSFHLELIQQANWATLYGCDALFFQRPARAEHQVIIEVAKRCGKKVWLDFDDMMFDVPISNSAHKVYSSNDTKQRIAEMIVMADIVTVSTDAIKAAFDPLRKAGKKEECVVVRNAWDDNLMPVKPERFMERNPIVYWRGSATHDGDLMYHLHGIVEIIKNYPKINFSFIGEPAWMLREALHGFKNVSFAGVMDPLVYFEAMTELRPALCMVPLRPDRFNSGKSNIAWMEAAYFGAAAVVPQTAEWNVPGAIPYADKEGFVKAMIYALDGHVIDKNPKKGKTPALWSDILGKNSEISWEHVKASMTVDQANKIRRDVLDRVLA